MKKVYDIRGLTPEMRVKLLEKLHLDGISNTPLSPPWLAQPEVEVLIFGKGGGVLWADYSWASEQSEYDLYKPDVTVEYRFTFEKVDTTPREIMVNGRTYRLVD